MSTTETNATELTGEQLLEAAFDQKTSSAEPVVDTASAETPSNSTFDPERYLEEMVATLTKTLNESVGSPAFVQMISRSIFNSRGFRQLLDLIVRERMLSQHQVIMHRLETVDGIDESTRKALLSVFSAVTEFEQQEVAKGQAVQESHDAEES